MTAIVSGTGSAVSSTTERQSQISSEFRWERQLPFPSGMSKKPYDIRERTYLFARESIAFGRER